jgi:hypothetical protein
MTSNPGVKRSVRRLPVTATGRQLNDGEMAVPRLIQEIWGSENTEAAVLFRDDEPWILTTAADGGRPRAVK